MFGKTDILFNKKIKPLRSKKINPSIVASWHDKKLRKKLAQQNYCNRCHTEIEKKYKYCFDCLSVV